MPARWPTAPTGPVRPVVGGVGGPAAAHWGAAPPRVDDPMTGRGLPSTIHGVGGGRPRPHFPVRRLRRFFDTSAGRLRQQTRNRVLGTRFFVIPVGGSPSALVRTRQWTGRARRPAVVGPGGRLVVDDGLAPGFRGRRRRRRPLPGCGGDRRCGRLRGGCHGSVLERGANESDGRRLDRGRERAPAEHQVNRRARARQSGARGSGCVGPFHPSSRGSRRRGSLSAGPRDG